MSLPARLAAVTWPEIEALQPCEEALTWGRKHFAKRKSIPKMTLVRAVMRHNLDWANWLIVRLMTYQQYVAYAIYAAEQVLDLYERRFPNDPRPRNAIEAARACVHDPSQRNKAGAAWAARAAEAAGAAWEARAAGAAWAAERKQMQTKILRYGLALLAEKAPRPSA